jgi:hypothetical protein
MVDAESNVNVGDLQYLWRWYAQGGHTVLGTGELRK